MINFLINQLSNIFLGYSNTMENIHSILFTTHHFYLLPKFLLMFITIPLNTLGNILRVAFLFHPVVMAILTIVLLVAVTGHIKRILPRIKNRLE